MTLTPRETTFVQPFYSKLMRMNASWVGGEVWNDLVHVGRTATLDDALWLLDSGAWRSVVMGAWLSLRFRRADIGTAVLRALQESHGSLTVPPLAVAAVTIVGADAASVLQQSDARSDEASIAVLDAALEHLGAGTEQEVSQENRLAFADMLAFAERLRAAFSAP